MSVKVMSQVWEDAPVAGTEMLMLLALADMCNDDRECWPSVRHLMHKVRVSEAQARRLLKSLERQNIIEVLLKAGKGMPGRESNRYRVCDLTPIAGDTTTGIAHDTLNHHIESSMNNTPKPPKGAKRASTQKVVIPRKSWDRTKVFEYYGNHTAALDKLTDAWGYITRFKDVTTAEGVALEQAYHGLEEIHFEQDNYQSLSAFTHAKLGWKSNLSPVDMLSQVEEWRKSRLQGDSPVPKPTSGGMPTVTDEQGRQRDPGAVSVLKHTKIIRAGGES